MDAAPTSSFSVARSPWSSGPYWRRRIGRHGLLAVVSLGGLVAMAGALGIRDGRTRVSMASAYVGLGLLAITLLLGPIDVLRGRRSPTSTDLRRDVGIWAGLIGLLHLVVGLGVHLRGRPWLYFVYPANEAHALPLRHDLFGFANDTGLLGGLVLVLLLALSNDWSLRRLGAPRWKALQRWNYAGAALVVAHGIGFQVIEKRKLGFVLAFAIIATVTLAAQLAGFRRHRAGER